MRDGSSDATPQPTTVAAPSQMTKPAAVLAAGAPEAAVTPGNLAAAYRVAARVERCTRGRLHVLYDGTTDPASSGAGGNVASD